MYAILTQKQRERFEEELELDFAYRAAGPGPLPGQPLPPARRARCGVPDHPVRDQAARGARRPAVASPTSRCCRVASSSSPARPVPASRRRSPSLVDLANRQRHDHIMTVEDPIEFLHTHKACLVNQREVGEDTCSFANALKHVLRQDPDIILVGEMRDLETISRRADRGRDRPPRLRHPAHPGRGADDRPCHRRVPVAPAAADPGAAGRRAPGRHLPDRCARPTTARRARSRPRCWSRRPRSAT